MTVGKANQAAEAARRAEEARQRAEAARQRAEAARKAAEAKKAQVKEAQKAVKEAPKGEADRAEGLLKEARKEYKEADRSADQMKEKAQAKDQSADKVESKAKEVARQELDAIRQDVKEAKSPQDIRKAAERSRQLQEAVGENPELGAEAETAAKLSEAYTKGADALEQVEDLKQSLEGSPEQRANSIAKLLADPATQEGLAGLKGLKGSAALDQAKQDLKEVSKQATPEKLAELIEKNPDLTKYPPEFAGNVAKLRAGLEQSAGQLKGQEAKQAEQALDALGGALDKSAAALLSKPGGLTLDEIKSNPGLGQVLATAKDPELKAKLAETAKGWAKESLMRNLEGKEGEDGVEDAVEAFQEEMKGLIESTALSQDANLIGAIQEGAKGLEGDSEVSGRLKEVAEDNGGGVGGFLKDVADTAVDILGKGSELLGKAIDAFGDLSGGLTDKLFDVAGKLNPANLALKGLSGTLDAVGLDGAADFVGKGSELIEKGYDLAGDAVNKLHDFQLDVVQGFRQGITGIATGVISTVAHPLRTAEGIGQAFANPGETAKALWNEASKHGIGGAIGYVGANALPAILSGGASLSATGAGAIRALSTGGRFASLGSKLPTGLTARLPDPKTLDGYATRLENAHTNLANTKSLLGSLNRQGFKKAELRAAQEAADASGTKAPTPGRLADENKGARAELRDGKDTLSQAKDKNIREVAARAENLYVEGYVKAATKLLEKTGLKLTSDNIHAKFAYDAVATGTANARTTEEYQRLQEAERYFDLSR